MLTAPELLTPRLRLREIGIPDFEATADMWKTPSVVRHVGGTPFPRTHTWNRLLKYAGLWPLLGYGYWTVEERSSGAFVGQAGLGDFGLDIEPSLAAIPEAGWVVAPQHEGKGYATEAVAAVLYWADTHLPTDRVCCLIEPGNRASLRVAAKLGFEFSREAGQGAAVTQVFLRSRPE